MSAEAGLPRYGPRLAQFAARHPRVIIPIGFFLIALIFISPLTLCPNCVGYQYGSPFSDLMISHLPNAEYLHDSLLRYGQWPLWNALIFAGQPLAADPLAGMWYPPNLLLLVLPLPFGFNLLFALHLTGAGYGLFRYLQDRGLGDGAALFGGLAFAGTPKLIAHLGAGHVSLVFALAWTPWLLRALDGVRVHGGWRRGALAGAALALIFLADVRWSFYAAALAAAYWLAALPALRANVARAVLAALAFGIQFLLLSAALLLPLVEFMMRSHRGALTLAEAGVYSLPPYYLLGLLIPDVRGFHEWMTYLGVLPLLLALLGARRRNWFWIATVFAALLFALGQNTPLYPLLYGIVPGLGWLRVPSRAWFIVALGVGVLAAHGLQFLLEVLLPRLKTSPALPRLSRYAPSARALLVGVIAFTLFDLWRVDVTLVEARPRPEPHPAAQWLVQQPGLFRVYSPSFSLPFDALLQHVEGVDPLQLAASVQFIQALSGVPAPGYSVTLPAFSVEDVTTAAENAIPDAAQLGLLNVRYVVARFPLNVPELKPVQIVGDVVIYEHLEAQPRAWMDTGAPADVTEWSPNRIVVTAQGPGRLVLSEVAYPGWIARVDGADAPIETTRGLLRSVSLASGAHTVVFEFWPLSVRAGLGLSALGIVLLAGLWRWGR